ncbi:MAG: Fic family protein, partial [Syntrophobacterales bacterium]|nr:Fic family protein [Syntrophobacterales bacterium]
MNFAKIDVLKEQLQAASPLSETELRRLCNEFIIENTYNSNAIEGNTLTLRETALILQENITVGGKPLKEHLEAVGHRDAFAYVMTLADENADLTERVIKELHSLVLMNDSMHKGKYRDVPVVIAGAARTPPNPVIVPEQMERLMAEYPSIKQNKHIIEAAAEFHLRFEEIHPFIDGNGRTGRLIM